MGFCDLWCAALSGRRALVFPVTGTLRAQRPQPSASLQFWLCAAVRSFTFQMVWAAVYFGLSFRRAPIGLILNPPYIVAALLGVYGALRLTWQLVAISVLASIFIVFVFMLFIVLNYLGGMRTEDENAWIVLPFYLPGLAVDLAIALIAAPLVLRLYRAEKAAAAAPAAESELGAAPSAQRCSGSVAPEAVVPVAVATPVVAPQEPQQEPQREPEPPDEHQQALGQIVEFRCPITLEVMRDPVIAADGHSYERVALEEWLRSHGTSPVTGARLEHKLVTPNHKLRSLIQSGRAAPEAADGARDHERGGQRGVTVQFVGN